jgi:hypothetical protein
MRIQYPDGLFWLFVLLVFIICSEFLWLIVLIFDIGKLIPTISNIVVGIILLIIFKKDVYY